MWCYLIFRQTDMEIDCTMDWTDEEWDGEIIQEPLQQLVWENMQTRSKRQNDNKNEEGTEMKNS